MGGVGKKQMTEDEGGFYVDTVVFDDETDRNGEKLMEGDLVVKKYGEDAILSGKYETKFRLCCARCVRKEHFGSFENDVFTCQWYAVQKVHPLDVTLGGANIRRDLLNDK